MPLPRFQRLDPDKRAQLLMIASREFADRGYEAASLNDILASAGLGKSSYYYYFADKEDLYATVIEAAFAHVSSKVEPPDLTALNAETFWPALEAYVSAMSAAVARTPDFVTLLRPLQGLWRNPTERFRPIVEAMRAQYRAGIDVGRRLGCVRSDLDTDLLISMLQAADAALDEHLMNQWEVDQATMHEHGRVAFDTVRRLLEPRSTPVPRPTRNLRVVRSIDSRL